jgi:hypothetical protein
MAVKARDPLASDADALRRELGVYAPRAVAIEVNADLPPPATARAARGHVREAWERRRVERLGRRHGRDLGG